METKICYFCKTEKELSEFHNNRSHKDGKSSSCKMCHNLRKKPLTNEQKERKKVQDNGYYKNLTSDQKLRRKEYWIKLNKTDKEKERKKTFNENNKEKVKLSKQKWEKENPNYRKEYRKNNKPMRNLKTRERILKDPLFKLKHAIRVCIRQALKNNGYVKKSRTHDILGCTYEAFLLQIETQWSLPQNLNKNSEVWMNWQNHGLYNGELDYGWDIDHIIPLASAISENDVLNLNKYTNLQPLCSYINRVIKRDNI